MPRGRLLSRPFLLACFLLAAYAAVALLVAPGRAHSAFGVVVLCLAPLVANLGLLSSSGSHYRRQNAFWVLWAAGCALWSAAELLWAIPLLHGGRIAPQSAADLLFFLSFAPMLAALSLRPHRRSVANALRNGYIDLLLLLGLWLYLYGYFVVAPSAFSAGSAGYAWRYAGLTAAANLLLVPLLFHLWRPTRAGWRRLYGHLLGAVSLHAAGWLEIRWALARGVYRPGSLWDVPLIASFLWFGWTGMEAHRLKPAPEEQPGTLSHRWALRLEIEGITSLSVLGALAILGAWNTKTAHFRLDLTLGAILVGMLLLLLRQRRVDRYRHRILEQTQISLDKKNRLQAYLVLTEKLASLGDLAAGAARGISDPLTAIFGYTALLKAESGAGPRVRSATQKIEAQAHRTRGLVENLLRFARQAPSEKTLLDLNALLLSVIQLHRFHLADSKVVADLECETNLPAVRGDAKLLLQVFDEIIENAADAMRPQGGGRLNIRTRMERDLIVAEFADTGPGLDHPELVFDPFYTTKGIGEGTGLGLSMCFGIIQEHAGEISCHNGPQGGAVFRISLPAVILPLPLRSLLEPVGRSS
jgi:signal transduction histidine kinase